MELGAGACPRAPVRRSSFALPRSPSPRASGTMSAVPARSVARNTVTRSASATVAPWGAPAVAQEYSMLWMSVPRSSRGVAVRPGFARAWGGLVAVGAALGCLVLPRPAAAVPFDNAPKILLHVKSTTTKNACTTYANLSDCQTAVTRGGLVTSASGPFYFVYVLVATGSYRGNGLGGTDLGLAGAQFGIHYDAVAGSGVDVFTWTLCATLEFVSTGWPDSDGGELLTWDAATACVKNEVGVAGYFYAGAYSTDLLKITARPVDSNMKVADCQSQEITLDPANDGGSASFTAGGTTDGCNPCLAGCSGVPVESTTWGKIKALWH